MHASWKNAKIITLCFVAQSPYPLLTITPSKWLIMVWEMAQVQPMMQQRLEQLYFQLHYRNAVMHHITIKIWILGAYASDNVPKNNPMIHELFLKSDIMAAKQSILCSFSSMVIIETKTHFQRMQKVRLSRFSIMVCNVGTVDYVALAQ